MTETKVAIVTGGNRGIGYEVCRQLATEGFHVILTARNAEKGKQAAETLSTVIGRAIDFVRINVTQPDTIFAAAENIRSRLGRVDVLINNAGILPDNLVPGQFDHRGILETPLSIIEDAIRTNVYGVILMCQAIVPIMKLHGYGRIVNVSSTMGQLSTIDGGTPGYRISKVALNAVTRIVAGDLEGTNILCNSVSPGWVRTEMGGPNANLSVEEGAREIVKFAMLPDGGPNGGFFRNGAPIEW